MDDKNDNAIKMLATALRMEEKGKAFYDKAAASCSNEPGKKIFSSLAQEEVVHMSRISSIYESLSDAKPWAGEWKDMKLKHEYLVHIFRGLAQKHATNVTANADDIASLDIGIEFEADSMAFYKQHLENAALPMEKEFLELMIEEETTHHKALIDMKFYLQDPEGWFREMEKGGLDGA